MGPGLFSLVGSWAGPSVGYKKTTVAVDVLVAAEEEDVELGLLYIIENCSRRGTEAQRQSR